MRAILRNWSGERVGPVAMSELRELFRRKLDETRQAIARHQDLERELVDSLHYLSTCEVCDSPRATNVCVECPQDHGMEHEPALVAGLFSARKERLPRRPKPRAGFVRMEDVGRG
jgi:glutamate/tyrosine decarboxylase-like PLP-dependent enzyme